MSIYERPVDEEIIKFLEVILNKDNRPVFVYCISGRNRTGVMVAMLSGGWFRE